MYSKQNSIEKLASKLNMFQVNNSDSVSKYTSFNEINSFNKIGYDLIKKDEKEVLNILRIFKDFNTEKSELIATLYAVWNDLLLEKKKITDQEIVNNFLTSWHEKKKAKFENKLNDIKRALKFMRDNNIIPKGKKNKTLPLT